MIDDQLAVSIEKVGERLLAVRAVEHAVLYDPDPRQLALLLAEFIVGFGKLVFLRQMRPARSELLFSCNESVVHHGFTSL